MRAKILHRLIDVRAIVVTQNEEKGYNRLDYFVKLLAIEEENGLNNYGWKLLEKMEGRRSSERFRAQIKDYEKSIEDKQEYNLELVVLDRSLNIRAGSNSVAIALFYGIPKIECVALLNKVSVRRTGEYLKRRGFSNDDIQLVEDRASDYVKKCDTDFLWILWPTVRNHYNDILDDIKKHSIVTKWNDIILTSEQIEALVSEVYILHKMNKWIVEYKATYLKKLPGSIRLIYVKHNWINFKCPGPSDDILLKQNETVKLAIRDKYNYLIEDMAIGFIHNEDSFERDMQLRNIIDNVVRSGETF